ncbi:VOC family protein [Paenibacillus sepulcri]|uniref:VOC family protein n=2 Tax=Paenibacillus sepulcri TaxID=359917 RepID=A0ABS7C6W7_9BACL|nr:VOC family protein [Paenibacillus sepulcri]
MFSGKAEEAMNFYISLFGQSEVNSIMHHEDGTVMHAVFTLRGQSFMCIDSIVEHAFTFTPAISLFVSFKTEEEINRVFERLSEGGQILMPLAPSPVSEKFGWVADQYGVSWQLNLAKG